MNERIRELQKQALVPGHWSDNGERFIGAHIDMEKFAELIVRECAKIAEKEQKFSNQYSLYNIDRCILVEFGL